jgi:hypothetical protein
MRVLKAVGPVPFRAYLDGMPDVGQGSGWTARQWRRAPVRTVQLTDLVAINHGGYLNERIVRRYMRSSASWTLPCVVEHNGCLYVADGHHRAVAAYRRGDLTLIARVMIT